MPLNCAHTEEEIANDPMNPIPYWTQALARYVYGDLAGAERRLRHAIELSPNNGYQHYLMTRIAFAQGNRQLLEETTKVTPDSIYNRASLVLALHSLGRSREADAALKELMTHDSKHGAYQVAEAYAALGQPNDAMTWLEQAYALHDAGLWTLQVDPLLRGLAEEPRFRALKAKLHM
jgi:tetratricopeptide (TPR) repeat protein